jgi:hypothetical protein
MPDIAIGYGSKWHLMRYLAWHRGSLDSAVLQAMDLTHTTNGNALIEWQDFQFAKAQLLSAEIKGIDFLESIPNAWTSFWPTGRGIMNWDAVARVKTDTKWEWLLVEAKAHIGELRSDCKATSRESLLKIETAFKDTKSAIGAAVDADWKNGYYQYANRLAVLHFLSQHSDRPIRMLFIYFIGDMIGWNRKSPQAVEEWKDELARMRSHLGLPSKHCYSEQIHDLYISVGGTPI